jgi:serine protease Do
MKKNDCSDSGQIKFRETKRRSNTKRLVKTGCLMIIAFVGGTVGAYSFCRDRYQKIEDAVQDSQRFLVDEDKEEEAFTNIINKVAPAVVGISKVDRTFDVNSLNQMTLESGFIFDSKGYIVTNYHTIQDEQEVNVKLAGYDSKPMLGKVKGYSKELDIAVIKIDELNLPSVVLGDSSEINIGDKLLTIGNPLGEEVVGYIDEGKINSNIKKFKLTQSENSTVKFIRTNIDITSKNNGGPICNEEGKVIAIANMKLGSVKNLGTGFSGICMNDIKKVIYEFTK